MTDANEHKPYAERRLTVGDLRRIIENTADEALVVIETPVEMTPVLLWATEAQDVPTDTVEPPFGTDPESERTVAVLVISTTKDPSDG